MDIQKYNLFSNLAGLEGTELFKALASTIYNTITVIAIGFAIFKVLEASYQIIRKSNTGAPAWQLVEHKDEIWDACRGAIFLALGITVINILIGLIGIF